MKKLEYTALYRKFRPLTFDEIVGQEHIVRTLKNEIINGRIGHAYLFNGGRGTGKTSAAKILARAVNCLNPKDGEPCNECEICKAALDGSLTDIVEMDAASNNSVEDVRAIRDEVNFLPTVAKYRVYIIDEVHMLSTGAFNALLKTLEEPPAHVKFILATTEPQKLPATILSRCQRFDFKKISNADIEKRLSFVCKESKIDITDEAKQLIAVLAEGAMRDALSILERCLQEEGTITDSVVKELVGIPKTESVNKIVKSILEKDTQTALQSIDEIIAEGKDITNFLWEIIKYVKDILVYKVNNKLEIYNEDEKAKIKELADSTEKDRLVSIIFELSNLENDIKWSTQKNIVFQVGILKLCGKESMSLEERIGKLENVVKSGKIISSNNQNQMKQSTVSRQIVDNSAPKTNNGTAVKASEIAQNKKSAEPTVKAKGVNFWSNVIETLKEQRKPILYSNLINTNGVMIDDMTVGIEFPNGLTSFGRSVIERPENMAELKRLVSMECKQDMRIKLIDKNVAETQDVSQASPIDLGIKINMIDE